VVRSVHLSVWNRTHLSALAPVGDRITGGWYSRPLLLILLFGLALALGLYRIGSKSIWLDEAVSLKYVRADPAQLAQYLTQDTNGSLYYVLLYGWTAVVGYGEGAVRALSAIFAAGSVPLLYLSVRRWADPLPAVVAALLLASSQMFVHYAQEARMYALALFLVVAATLALQVAVERRSWRWWWPYALLAGLAVYAHLWTSMVLAAHLLWLLTCHRGRIRQAFAAYAAVLVACLPLLYFTAGHGSTIAWIPPLTQDRIYAVLFLMAGSSWPLFVVAGQAILRTGWLAGIGNRAYALPLAIGVVPIVLTIGISIYRPILVDRYLLFSMPSLAAVCAIAVFSFKPRWVALLAAAWLVGVAATTSLSWYGQVQWQDFRTATLDVTSRAAPGEVVLVYPGYQQPGYDYYVYRLGHTGDPPTAVQKWQLESSWPASRTGVWMVTDFANDGKLAALRDELTAHGYVQKDSMVRVPDFLIRHYVRASP
jgi:4-amino-4-deoxy-L-arabinose transferase-like glycosyltransferase